MMGALMFASKAALAAIPNVNFNAVLIILAVVYFGWKAMYMIAVYVMLEGLIFGISVWWFSYLYAWPAVTAFLCLFRKNRSPLIWATLAGLYGLLFGPLMYIGYFTINGWHMVFAMWVAGIPYDLTHCVSNFILTLVLYRPLYRVMEWFVPVQH